MKWMNKWMSEQTNKRMSESLGEMDENAWNEWNEWINEGNEWHE